MTSKEEIAEKLFEIGAVKFGCFRLVSGLLSPIYVDLRFLITYPEVLKSVASYLGEQAKALQFDRIAGIPYTALPIATIMAQDNNWPMVYPRKEVKDHGTKKQVEGLFKEGETVLVIDDVIAKGTSKFKAIAPLEAIALKVKDVLVLVDREMGGQEELKEKGYELHSALKMSEMLQALLKAEKISQEQVDSVNAYLADPEDWTKKHEGEMNDKDN
jgi:uridine monophosphate synthetase